MKTKTTNLSNRQTQVLQGVSAGETSKETAKRLSISSRTVESYREEIMRAMRAKNSSEACALALKRGVLKRGKFDK
jgi:DNA-binding NarL/FixJ family response regulator